MVKEYYKCIEPVPPTAINAVFLKDEKGDLEFKTMVKDDEYYSEQGYNHAGIGDSGSPLWKETYPGGTNNPDSGEKRQAVIAVLSSGSGLDLVSITDTQDKCPDLATKVTPDIIAWVKKVYSYCQIKWKFS